MYELERREAELALEEKRQLEAKRTLLQEAARKQDEPVDDSKLVEAMFDFLPDSSSEAPAPKDTSVFSDLPQQRADQQEVIEKQLVVTQLQLFTYHTLELYNDQKLLWMR